MINEVRNTVMAVLNKDNNGYVTPEEFNLFARQAQLELFEEYFYDYSRSVVLRNNRRYNSGYSNIPKQTEEVIDTFSTSASLSYATIQIDVTGALTGTFSAGDTVTQAGTVATAVVASYDTSSAVKVLRLNTVVGTFNTTGTITGSAPGTLSVPMTVTVLSNFLLPSDWYTVTTVEYNSLEVERLSRLKALNLINSNLTAPTTSYPAYYQNGATPSVGGNSIVVYPTTITTGVSVNYVRYPQSPKWTYNTVGGSPVFNVSAADYQDFELPDSDQPTLVLKILQLAGVNIREPEVVQYAMNEESIEDQKEG